MGKVLVELSMSLDGFIAGPNDGPDNGLGDGGELLFRFEANPCQDLCVGRGWVTLSQRLTEVADIRAAHAQLVARGVAVSEVQVLGPDGARPAREDDELNFAGFVFFSDPDGNGWAVQQITARLI